MRQRAEKTRKMQRQQMKKKIQIKIKKCKTTAAFCELVFVCVLVEIIKAFSWASNFAKYNNNNNKKRKCQKAKENNNKTKLKFVMKPLFCSPHKSTLTHTGAHTFVSASRSGNGREVELWVAIYVHSYSLMGGMKYCRLKFFPK